MGRSQSYLAKVARWIVLTAGLVGLPMGAWAGPITFGTYLQFGFSDVGIAATGCDPADPGGSFCINSGGTPTTFLDAPPWTFSVGPAGGQLTVVDAFTSGDQFEIFNNGISLGLTSVPGADGDCGDDPVVCLADATMSKGTFVLAAGDYSLAVVPTLSLGGGSGYFRVDAERAQVPEPATAGLFFAVALAWQLVARRRHKAPGVRTQASA